MASNLLRDFEQRVTRTDYTWCTVHLVSQGSQNAGDGGEVGGGSGFALESDLGLLLGVVSLLLDLSLSLKLSNQISVTPSNLLGQLAQHSEVAVSAQSQGLQSRGNHHTLLLVIRLGNTLEGLLNVLND